MKESVFLSAQDENLAKNVTNVLLEMGYRVFLLNKFQLNINNENLICLNENSINFNFDLVNKVEYVLCMNTAKLNLKNKFEIDKQNKGSASRCVIFGAYKKVKNFVYVTNFFESPKTYDEQSKKETEKIINEQCLACGLNFKIVEVCNAEDVQNAKNLANVLFDKKNDCNLIKI